MRSDRSWQRIVKPRPAEIDEWTHALHGPDNNAVANDSVVGPPRHLQWVADPKWARSHDQLASISVVVTSGGRLFYIVDEGSRKSILLPAHWSLIARDAFNGKLLWKRKIPKWQTRMYPLKSGPTQLTRRLVATPEHVYVTLGLYAPVSKLDAATGKTLKTYKGTRGTEEILFKAGTLYLLVRDKPPTVHLLPTREDYFFPLGERRILAVDALNGKILWQYKSSNVYPMTLTVDSEHVYFAEDGHIVCLRRSDGRVLWRSQALSHRKLIQTFFAPTLVAYNDVLLYSGGSERPFQRNQGGGMNLMYALSKKDGTVLWKGPHPSSGYRSPEDILVLQGLVWTGETTLGALSGEMIGRDPLTGKVKIRFLPDVKTHWFHHRCYRAKATEKYILTSRTGIEFVDVAARKWLCHHWVRGACLYGTMPAYGMIFNPPHPCACYIEAKLFGFNALEGDGLRKGVARKGRPRLIKGPAYDTLLRDSREKGTWPTYRHDSARSGSTTVSVSPPVEVAWVAKIGGKLSSPVVAEGKVFVSSIDRHTLYALDSEKGTILWTFIAGGRIDSPPTIWRGRVYFGCTDGWVYCLRASDGIVAWQFRAAPLDLQLGAFEQIESVWPVHGSVLIFDNELWCVAGRSMFLDGGLRLIRLDPVKGKLIDEKILDNKDPKTGRDLQTKLKGLNMPVALPDILSFDGKFVYMRSQRFDRKGNRLELELPTFPVGLQRGEGEHLFSPTGFLDDVWWHRSYWIYGRIFKSGAGGYYQAGRVTPAGKPLVFNESTVFGYGRLPKYYRWTTPMEYQLFAAPKRPKILKGLGEESRGERIVKQVKKKAARRKKAKQRRRGLVRRRPPTRIAYIWKRKVPILVRAMVLCGKVLYVAGPPDLLDEEEAFRTFSSEKTQKLLERQARAYEGAEGGVLWAVSALGGNKLAEKKIGDIPVFDGLVAAYGKLYICLLYTSPSPRD